MMWDAVFEAFRLVFDPYVLVVIVLSAVFGIFVGAMPGLTATMATALLVPVTFFMPQVPALGAIVTATAMAIFAGDIPAAMLRIPGTPASAAYTDESYEMSKKGLLDLNLGVNLVFSVTRRPVRRRHSDRRRAAARRGRHQLLLVRVFLAGGAGAHLCGVHRHRQPAQGLRVSPCGPGHRLHRHRSGGWLSALHIRHRSSCCRASASSRP